jgi:Ser/Thr protein kinase RdoA (MazF antagonist)
VKYVNGQKVLPKKLLNEIRKYIEGAYLYIPKSDMKKNKWGEKTNYRSEMLLRNQRIYDKYMQRGDILAITECFHLSAQSVRRIILEQKRKGEPLTIMINELIKEWGIECNPVQIYHSAWNINDTYVLKVYHDSNALQRNIVMMRTLKEEGIPVPGIIKLPDGRDFLESEDKLYVLTTKLRGNNIVDLIGLESDWFYEFGKVLANLHFAFLKCESKISYWNNSMIEEMRGWVSRDLLKFSPDYLTQAEIKEAVNELADVYDELPKQLIHRDVNLGNFLFDKGAFSGYIDFDLSQRNIRIFDLCYFLLGLYSGDAKFQMKEQVWYNIVCQVVRGYHSIAKLNTLELKAIVTVMKNIELLFVAYFLGIGDEISAKDAADLFTFVKLNEKSISEAINIG